MATINSLTSSSSSSSAYGSSSTAIGGLVSGLNTDELIDGMTIGTRSKIAKQKQNQTLLSWKSDAYRTVSDKLVSFADSYSSYSSSTNLSSASFYSRSVITASGDNSKCVSVSGKVNSGQQLAVNGIKQLAKDASLTTTQALSNNIIQTGVIGFDSEDSCTLVGKSFTVKYGSNSYLVTMPLNPEEDGGGLYTSAADVAAGINEALGKVDIGSGKTLSSVMSVTANGEKLNFKNESSAENALSITGGNSSLLSTLGIAEGSSTLVGTSITAAGLDAVAEINPDNLHAETSFTERMLGKSVIFNYNGTSKTITFDDATQLTADKFAGYLQGKLDSAFGNGRIDVSMASGKLQIKTVSPPSGDLDTSSVLSMSSSSFGLMGEGSVFGIANASSNKLNLANPLEESGLKNMESTTLVDGTEYEVRINGKSIKITYEEGKTSLQDIISAINADTDADVHMTYQANSDSFSIVSTQDGASGAVEIGDTDKTLNSLERLLFGIDSTSNVLNGETVAGQDAIILVDYDGEGGANPVEISRGTNSFTLNGMNIVAKTTFGYAKNASDELEYVAGTDAITFDAKVDTDKVISAIKSMVEAYNALVETTNTSVSEKRDRKYPPLTDEQKEDMTEKEIANWETKAKAGMLFGDSDISNLTNDLRFVFMNISSDGLSLSDLGITISTDWKDNGKITLDESALKTALEEDPESVKKMFTAELDNGSLQTGGIISRMKAITDKYAATTGSTKGILVEKAGNSKSPTSLLSNSLQKQMDDIDDIIEKLEDRLKTERTRYQNQFTQLEVLMQKMNTQSSWLSDYSGY